MSRSLATLVAGLLLWTLALGPLLACGAGPDQKLESARERLAEGDYAEAAEAARAGLAAGASGATAWRLELAALEAEARGNQGDLALARLERLAGARADQVRGALFLQTAGQLREAGDAAGAIALLDAGARRFPEDADLRSAIEQAKASGSSDELEKLRSLGYIQ